MMITIGILIIDSIKHSSNSNSSSSSSSGSSNAIAVFFKTIHL